MNPKNYMWWWWIRVWFNGGKDFERSLGRWNLKYEHMKYYEGKQYPY
jgi:hypothetical protein